MNMRPQTGTYALALSCSSNAVLEVGRLGRLQLQPGYYLYIGSAFGPGGVQARVRHHLKSVSRPHWHIDYLRRHIEIDEVWCSYDPVSHEHEWADIVRSARDVQIPLVGFGSSDCRCKSHLFFFKRYPLLGDLLGITEGRVLVAKQLPPEKG